MTSLFSRLFVRDRYNVQVVDLRCLFHAFFPGSARVSLVFSSTVKAYVAAVIGLKPAAMAAVIRVVHLAGRPKGLRDFEDLDFHRSSSIASPRNSFRPPPRKRRRSTSTPLPRKLRFRFSVYLSVYDNINGCRSHLTL